MLKRLLANNRVLIILDQAIFSGTSFLLTIFLARTLSIYDFGIYSGVVLGVFLFISLTSALIIQPFQVNIGNQENKNAYISFTFLSQSTILCASSFLLFCFFIFHPIPGLSLSACFFILFYAFHDYLRKVFLALDKAKKVVVLDLFCSAGQILVILVIFTSQKSISLDALFTKFAFAYLPSIVFGVIVLKPKGIPINLFKEFSKLHFIQGKWLFMTALVQWWSGNLFVVASGFYLGSRALGALRLAQSLFGVLNILLQTFENYVLPQTSLYFAKNKGLAIAYLAKMTKYAGIVFLLFMIFIFIFSEQVMEIAGGADFKEYAFLLKGMTILYTLIYICQPIRIGIRILHLNNYFFYGYAITLAFSILFSEYLLTHFSLYGALCGLIVSQFLLIIFWLLILSKKQFYLWKSFISF